MKLVCLLFVSGFLVACTALNDNAYTRIHVAYDGPQYVESGTVTIRREESGTTVSWSTPNWDSSFEDMVYVKVPDSIADEFWWTLASLDVMNIESSPDMVTWHQAIFRFEVQKGKKIHEFVIEGGEEELLPNETWPEPYKRLMFAVRRMLAVAMEVWETWNLNLDAQ